MMKSDNLESVSDRLERIYLGLLRGLTLVVATICIVGATLFAIDGARRALTPTEVKPEAVAVSKDEALGALAQPDNAQKTTETGEQAQGSEEARKVHAAFLKGPFEPYYQSYRRLAVAYNKPEDQVLTKPQLAEHLGYTADAVATADSMTTTDLASTAPAADAAAAEAAAMIDPAAAPDAPNEAVIGGLIRTANLFQRDAAFAQAQTTAVSQALADPRLVAKAQGYRAAQKSAQACRTDYELQTVWDPTSTACRDWYYEPYGCSVRRPTAVQKCEPAYPEGIRSPLELFTQVDESYRLAWTGKTLAAEAEAAATSSEKELVKAGAPASLMLALQIGAAFLVVMFLFLLIAVERHLRKVAQRRTEAPRGEPLAMAAE